MIVYTPIFYCAELKLAFKGKLTWKVADTLQYVCTVLFMECKLVVSVSIFIKSHVGDCA